MKGNLLKVKDHDNLAKDTRSKAVISTDEVGYRAALIAKERRKKLDKLENDVSDLKNMLSMIIQKLDK